MKCKKLSREIFKEKKWLKKQVAHRNAYLQTSINGMNKIEKATGPKMVSGDKEDKWD